MDVFVVVNEKGKLFGIFDNRLAAMAYIEWTGGKEGYLNVSIWHVHREFAVTPQEHLSQGYRMTLSQLKQKIDYALVANGDCELHVQLISDQHPVLNTLDDGRVNDVDISKPFWEGGKVLISIDLP